MATALMPEPKITPPDPPGDGRLAGSPQPGSQGVSWGAQRRAGSPLGEGQPALSAEAGGDQPQGSPCLPAQRRDKAATLGSCQGLGSPGIPCPSGCPVRLAVQSSSAWPREPRRAAPPADPAPCVTPAQVPVPTHTACRYQPPLGPSWAHPGLIGRLSNRPLSSGCRGAAIQAQKYALCPNAWSPQNPRLQRACASHGHGHTDALAHNTLTEKVTEMHTDTQHT